MDLTEFVAARLDEKRMHAEKDLWCARRASAGWEAHFGYNLPYSELRADDQVIARFTGTYGRPLADGEDDQHQADLMLAARMGSAAEPRAVRALREVESAQAVLGAYAPVARNDGPGEPEYAYGWAEGLGMAVRALAAVYRDHPDYDQEWAL